jgi:hypothetical protein
MAYLFIVMGVLFRLVPHLPNFTPIAAIALFGGAYLGKKQAVIVPLAIMIASDAIIGLHPLILFTWGSFILTAFIGMWLKENRTVVNVFGAAVSSSVIFFIITNFGVWALPASWYPRTLEGLMSCYIVALPFYRNMLLGDIFYVALFFGAYEAVNILVRRYYPKASWT